MSRRKKSKRSHAQPPEKRKMSDMISEVGGEFIGSGDTVEEKLNRLNAVCSAWNMACAAPELRQRQLAQYLEGFRQFNPDHSDEELREVRSTMEAFIQRKLQTFPSDQRQIVDAKIVPMGTKFRIEIASATLP